MINEGSEIFTANPDPTMSSLTKSGAKLLNSFIPLRLGDLAVVFFVVDLPHFREVTI